MFLSKGRKHSPGFKRGAIGQIRQLGVSCTQVARELGIASNLLMRWKRGSEVEGREAFDGAGKSTEEEVARLKRKLARGDSTAKAHCTTSTIYGGISFEHYRVGLCHHGTTGA